MSGWWIYEVAKAEEGGNSKKERLETYLERDEDVDLSSEVTGMAVPNTMLPEEVGA